MEGFRVRIEPSDPRCTEAWDPLLGSARDVGGESGRGNDAD